MSAAWNILARVMVRQFYFVNAGFFLFLFIFFFGIVEGSQLVSYHHSLMLAAISTPAFLFVIMMCWMVYNIKCIRFCTSALLAPDGIFLSGLKCLSRLKQLLLYLSVAILLYLPVLVYACFVAGVAIGRGAAGVASWVVVFQLLMIAMSFSGIYATVNKTSDSLTTKIAGLISSRGPVSIGYYGFIIGFILHSNKAVFAVVKIFSLLLLSMLFVRNRYGFDADLFDIFYPIAIIAHAGLVLNCVNFNETYLSGNRNLPVSWLKVSMMYLLTWALVFLPETAFMLINNHGNLPQLDIILQSVTGVVMLLLFTGIAYGTGLHMERYLLFVFLAYIALLILQKAAGNFVALAALFALALAVIKAHYYSFEKTTNA